MVIGTIMAFTPFLAALLTFLVNTYDDKKAVEAESKREIESDPYLLRTVNVTSADGSSINVPARKRLSEWNACVHENIEPVRNTLTLELLNVICLDCNEELDISVWTKRMDQELEALTAAPVVESLEQNTRPYQNQIIQNDYSWFDVALFESFDDYLEEYDA